MTGWLDLAAATAGSPAQVGGKARHLGALIAAGLPVPRGIVIQPGAPVPEAATSLRAPLVVRSSASIEDSRDAAAAGVFASVRDVGNDDLPAAIAHVRASAIAPAAAAYLSARDIDPSSVAMAVVIQEQISPELARGVVYTPGSAGDAISIEAHDGDLARAAAMSRDGSEIHDRDPGFPLDDDDLRQLCRLALAAESALAARGGADVEWVRGADRIWIVQARPIVRRRPRSAGPAPEALVFSRAEPDVIWRWDVTHNPDPLTPAQIALVHRVEPISPVRMRVVEGHLYTAPRRTAGLAPRASGLRFRTPETSAGAAPDRDALLALWQRVNVEVDAALAPLEALDAPPLVDAVAAYEKVFALHAELGTAIASVRRNAPAIVGVPAMTVPREHAGALAPAWDVAAPTYDPGDVADGELAPADLAAIRDAGALAHALAESDDLLFYRAQSIVRRALLAIATAAGLADPADIFYFPLVAAARAERERQRRLAMPLAISDGRSLAASSTEAGPGVWRGRGGGGTARGEVVRVEQLGAIAPGADRPIVVARAITPAMVVSLRRAGAIVAEFGGILGHATAMARELGIPYVVGCVGAWSGLSTGDRVVVDGEAGLVARLGTRDPAVPAQ